MKIVKKIITIFVTIILLLALSYNIYNFISIKVLNKDLPTINGYGVLEVISGSMEPKIKKGDIVIIDTKITNYKAKDIVTFKDSNGSYVTHRILEINNDKVITKGDANNTIDDEINIDSITGKYICKLSGLGALIKSLRNPITLVMILIVGILLCVLISTDSKGNAILTDEEKQYMEFLEQKNNKKKNSNKIKDKNNKEEPKKVSNKKTEKEETKVKTSNKKTVAKVSDKTAAKKTTKAKTNTKEEPKKVSNKKNEKEETKVKSSNKKSVAKVSDKTAAKKTTKAKTNTKEEPKKVSNKKNEKEETKVKSSSKKSVAKVTEKTTTNKTAKTKTNTKKETTVSNKKKK